MPRSRATAARLSVTRLLLLWLALLAVLLPATPAVGAASPATGDAAAGPVVLVGVNGVRWDDVDPDTTPALWSLLQEGAVGTVAVRSVRRQACPADGWLALSAGRRAADAPTGTGEPAGLGAPAGLVGSPGVGQQDPPVPACRPLLEPAALDADADAEVVAPSVPRWEVYVAEAEAGSFEAEPGLLGDTLAREGVPAVAIGPGAGIALARRDGVVAGRYTGNPGTAGALGRAVAEAVDQLAGADRRALLVVDAGEVRDPEDLGPGEPVDPSTPDRAAQVRQLDHRVAEVLDALPATATVLVVSLADSGFTPHLQLLAARGPGPLGTSYAGDLVASRSTRQDGLVQATDLTPTLLELLDVPAPAGQVGSVVQPLESSPQAAADRLEKVLDLDRAALAVQPLVPLFFNGLVVAQLLLYGAGAVALRRRWGGPRGRGRVRRWLRRVAIVFATVPVSTFLANVVPWWRAGNDLLAVVAATTVPVVVISLLALAGPWRRHILGPFGAVAAVTAVVLAADVLTGSRLMLSSLMGLQPVVAGRFYGFGNPAFSLFATGALLTATAVADWLLRAGRGRGTAAATVAVIAAVAVVVNGAPGLGSDFGGPPAMVPAFAVLAMLVGGVRLTWRRLALVAGGTVLVLLSLLLVDFLRPAEDRTHLGRFVETAISGGAWPVIERKASQNLAILTTSVLTLLVPFAALFVALVLMRPAAWGAAPLQRAYEHTTALRPGLVAFLVLQGIGFAVNDSGTAIPAVGATLAIPLLIAASVRALELHEPVEPGPSPPRSRLTAAPTAAG